MEGRPDHERSAHDHGSCDPALRPFASDHCIVRQRAGELIAASRPEERLMALTRFILAWREQIAPHFEDEERLLLPLMQDCSCRQRLLAEHEDLRRMASAAMLVGPDAEPEWVKRLGERLSDHIDWEEQELFPCVAKDLTPDARARLAEATRRIQRQ
jgi:hemerythrin-like domain-containing protein